MNCHIGNYGTVVAKDLKFRGDKFVQINYSFVENLNRLMAKKLLNSYMAGTLKTLGYI